MSAPVCTIRHQSFGHIGPQAAQLWTLSNPCGMSVSVCDFGAIITAIRVPTARGHVDCALGFDQAKAYTAAAYRAQYPYLGAVIGRHAGRIRHARAPLGNRPLQLAANHQGHQLHGGPQGFDSRFWQYAGSHADAKGAELRLHLVSEDGDQGYPGTLTVTVCYRLGADHSLSVDFEAVSTHDTLLNLTQHSYFHLGQEQDSVAEHTLWLAAADIIETDASLLPTGHLTAVDGSALDFRQPRPIADTVLDTAYVLPEHTLAEPVARLHHPGSGVGLTVYTDNPVLVVYNGAHLPALPAPGRKPLQAFGGICFEAQGYTDAANHPAFPGNLLPAGEIRRRRTVYAFSV